MHVPKMRYALDDESWHTPELKRMTEEAAGLDLAAAVPVAIPPWSIRKVQTNLIVEIPKGLLGLICSRSGHASKGIVVINGVGVIESDYRGELGVLLFNATDDEYLVKLHERVAQFVTVKNVLVAPVLTDKASLTATGRGTGGFGSTGA